VIEQLVLKNFQRHQNLTIDLDPHITTIVGPSDSGKSAVIRALRWLATNSPAGDAFIRDGEKKAGVVLTVDGETVERERGAGANIYRLGEDEFRAFGNEVPQKIGQMLNLGPLNFQGQHDSPFWFGETAGEVSRQLNKIVNLSIIDNVLSFLASRTREAKVEVSVLEQRKKEAQAERAALVHARRMDKDLRAVERAEEGFSKCSRSRSLLHDLFEQASCYYKETESLDARRREAEGVLRKGEAFQALAQRVKELKGVIEEIGSLQVQAKRPVPSVVGLEERFSVYTDCQDRAEGLRSCVSGIREKMDNLQSYKTGLRKAEKELKAEMGDVCPLCGQEVKK